MTNCTINQNAYHHISVILSFSYILINLENVNYLIMILLSVLIIVNLIRITLHFCFSNDRLKFLCRSILAILNAAMIIILWEYKYMISAVNLIMESIFIQQPQMNDVKQLIYSSFMIILIQSYFIRELSLNVFNNIAEIIVIVMLIFMKIILIILVNHQNTSCLDRSQSFKLQNFSMSFRSPKHIQEELVCTKQQQETFNIIESLKSLYQQEKILILNNELELLFCNFNIQVLVKDEQIQQNMLFQQFLEMKCKFKNSKQLISVRDASEEIINNVQKLCILTLKLKQNFNKKHLLILLYFSELKILFIHLVKLKNSQKEQKNIAQNFILDVTKSLSHNLGTNLNAINTFSKYALEDQQISSFIKDKYIEPIHINSQQLNLFISNVRDFSLIRLNQFDLKLEHFNIREEIEFVQSLFRDAIERRKLKIINPNTDHIIFSDKNRFRQVYFQLFSNSVKFTESGMIKTQIKFLNKQPNHVFQITVSDSGLGINTSELEVIQDIISSGRFLRVSKHSVGSGFGICISNQISKFLSGNTQGLTVESIQNATKFSFQLKVVNHDTLMKQLSEKSDQKSESNFIRVIDRERSYIEGYMSMNSKFTDKMISQPEFSSNKRISQTLSENNEQVIEQSGIIPEQSEYSIHHPPSIQKKFLGRSSLTFMTMIQSQCCSRVLIADDEIFNIFSLEIILKQYKTVIDTTFNGQEAINKIKNKIQQPCKECKNYGYYIIFLDINMPILDGLETAKQIKQLMNSNLIPKVWIIANSGFCDLQTKLSAQDAGFDHYLTKPIDSQQLSNLLMTLIEVKLNQKK